MKNIDATIGLNFRSLIWPIFIDNFLRMIVIVISYSLISRISDAMAAILGVTNLYLLIGFSLAECLAQGSSIILAQYLGAKRDVEVNQAYVITVWMNAILGLILSITFVTCSHFLLSAFGFSKDLIDQGSYYLSMVGSGFCVYALNYSLLYILNANGLTKYSMTYSLLVNGFSLGFYYVIAILPTSFTINRLALIALTNIFVRVCGMIFLILMVKHCIQGFRLYIKMPWNSTKSLILKFLKISIPNAFEPLSYHLFQFVIVKIISTINMESLSVRNYIISLTTLFETAAWSVSKGNQIMLGHLIGAGKIDFAKRQLIKGIIISFLASLIILYVGLTFRQQLMSVFSKDKLIIDIGSQLLIFVALLTLMRTFTLNLQAGLKAAGDIRFGLMLVTIQMWGITIPSSYVLTQYFRAGLKGIWVILMIDEFIRIFFFFQRWRSQKWKQL